MAIVSLSVVTNSLERSAAAVLQMGNADFMVAQKGSPTLLESVVTVAQAAGVAKTPGRAARLGESVTRESAERTAPARRGRVLRLALLRSV